MQMKHMMDSFEAQKERKMAKKEKKMKKNGTKMNLKQEISKKEEINIKVYQ